MERAVLICFVAAIILAGLSGTPRATLGVSVTEIAEGVMIESTMPIVSCLSHRWMVSSTLN